MKKYVDNVVRIPCSFDDFFSYWVEFLKPFHKLADRECQILSIFLEKRHQLSKVIFDEDILDTMLMSDEVKAEIREKGNISVHHLYAVLKSFEKKNVILNGRINRKFVPKIVPNVSGDNNDYKLMFLFDFKG